MLNSPYGSLIAPWGWSRVKGCREVPGRKDTMHAAIIGTDATVKFVETKPDGIGWLQDAVNGRFEVVQTGEADVWVNDEFLFGGEALNLIGSAIAGQPILGNVVVTGPPDHEGHSTGISDRLVALLRRDLTVVA